MRVRVRVSRLGLGYKQNPSGSASTAAKPASRTSPRPLPKPRSPVDSCSIASGRDGWRGGICCTSLRSYFTCCTGYCPASSQPPVPPHTCRVRLCLRQSLIAFFFVVFTALFFRSAANARRPELTSPLPGPAPARMILMSNSAVRCSPRRNETKPRGDALRRANANKAFPIQAHRTLLYAFLLRGDTNRPAGRPQTRHTRP